MGISITKEVDIELEDDIIDAMDVEEREELLISLLESLPPDSLREILNGIADDLDRGQMLSAIGVQPHEQIILLHKELLDMLDLEDAKAVFEHAMNRVQYLEKTLGVFRDALKTNDN